VSNSNTILSGCLVSASRNVLPLEPPLSLSTITDNTVSAGSEINGLDIYSLVNTILDVKMRVMTDFTVSKYKLFGSIYKFGLNNLWLETIGNGTFKINSDIITINITTNVFNIFINDIIQIIIDEFQVVRVYINGTNILEQNISLYNIKTQYLYFNGSTPTFLIGDIDVSIQQIGSTTGPSTISTLTTKNNTGTSAAVFETNLSVVSGNLYKFEYYIIWSVSGVSEGLHASIGFHLLGPAGSTMYINYTIHVGNGSNNVVVRNASSGETVSSTLIATPISGLAAYCTGIISPSVSGNLVLSFIRSSGGTGTSVSVLAGTGTLTLL
jgi:hypothetical protein